VSTVAELVSTGQMTSLDVESVILSNAVLRLLPSIYLQKMKFQYFGHVVRGDNLYTASLNSRIVKMRKKGTPRKR